jgi:hypothetical protein
MRNQTLMRTVDVLILAAACLVASNALAAAPEAGSTVLAQATPNTLDVPNPNALDAQDRYRANQLERDHREVKERLGDRDPRPTTNGLGFESPRTDHKPDVPDERTKSNQNR